MTTRDLSHEDIQGFLHAHQQRAEETRFAQLENEWTPASTLEGLAMLIGAFCLCMTVPVGYVLWRMWA